MKQFAINVAMCLAALAVLNRTGIRSSLGI